MIWERLHDHAIKSKEGYVILRCTADGKPTGRFVSMLGITTKTKMSQPLCGHDSADEAKAFCESHLLSTKASAA